jgi:predicted ATP-dependent Lon-type protease
LKEQLRNIGKDREFIRPASDQRAQSSDFSIADAVKSEAVPPELLSKFQLAFYDEPVDSVKDTVFFLILI